MSDRQRLVALAAMLIVLGLYVLPVVIAAVLLLTTELHGDRPFGGFLLNIMLTTGPYSFIPTLLVPLLAVLTVATLWSDRYWKWAVAALAIAGAGLIAAVIVWYMLDVERVASRLWFHADAPADSMATFRPAKNLFLRNILEGLGTFVAILLGLRAIPSGKGESGAR